MSKRRIEDEGPHSFWMQLAEAEKERNWARRTRNEMETTYNATLEQSFAEPEAMEDPERWESYMKWQTKIEVAKTSLDTASEALNRAESRFRKYLAQSEMHAQNEQPKDDELDRFWRQGIPKAYIDNNILRLGDNAHFLGNTELGNSVFVRVHYERFFDLILKLSQGKLTQQPCKWSVMVGSPGIGKKYFLFWLIWRLSNSKYDGPIILHTDEESYRFTNDGFVTYSNTIETFVSDLKKPDCWYLVKGVVPYFGSCGITVVVASPDRNKWYKLCKKRLAHRFYMPLFSLDELLQCTPIFPRYLSVPIDNNSSSIPKNVIVERYGKFGGMIRTVLEVAQTGDLPLMSLFEDVVEGLSDAFPKHLLRIEHIDKSPGLHRVVHLQVDDTESYASCAYQIATPLQARLVFKRFWGDDFQSALNFIEASKNISSISRIRSQIFSLWAYHLLKNGGGVRLQHLNERLKAVPLLAEIWEPQDLPDNPTAELPFTCYFGDTLVIVTVDDVPTITVSDENVHRLVFVVPPDLVDLYTEQSCAADISQYIMRF